MVRILDHWYKTPLEERTTLSNEGTEHLKEEDELRKKLKEIQIGGLDILCIVQLCMNIEQQAPKIIQVIQDVLHEGDPEVHEEFERQKLPLIQRTLNSLAKVNLFDNGRECFFIIHYCIQDEFEC
jgi:hypothetical protein